MHFADVLQILVAGLLGRLKNAAEPQRRLGDVPGLIQLNLPVPESGLCLAELLLKGFVFLALGHQQFQQIGPFQFSQFFVGHGTFLPRQDSE